MTIHDSDSLQTQIYCVVLYHHLVCIMFLVYSPAVLQFLYKKWWMFNILKFQLFWSVLYKSTISYILLYKFSVTINLLVFLCVLGSAKIIIPRFNMNFKANWQKRKVALVVFWQLFNLFRLMCLFKGTNMISYGMAQWVNCCLVLRDIPCIWFDSEPCQGSWW